MLALLLFCCFFLFTTITDTFAQDQNIPPETPLGYIKTPMGGCFDYKLNYFVWFPITLFESIEGVEVNTCLIKPQTLIIIITPYWAILSYIFSCFVFYILSKLKQKTG